MQLDTVALHSREGKSQELIAFGILLSRWANRDQLESASIRFVGERLLHGGGSCLARELLSSRCYHGLDRGIMVLMLFVS
jgi:hypothetical protein